MKRRRLDRAMGNRVTQRRFFTQRLETDAFTGHVWLLCIDAAREPLHIRAGDRQVCIADAGHSWLTHDPDGAHHRVTTMFDAGSRVVQWYIDICGRHGVDEQGVPWYDDLYLDVTRCPPASSRCWTPMNWNTR